MHRGGCNHASGWNPESAGGSRVSSRSTDVATLSRPEHLRINIDRSVQPALPRLSQLCGVTHGRGSRLAIPQSPREFTRHWPPIFGMKLPLLSTGTLPPVSRAKNPGESGESGSVL